MATLKEQFWDPVAGFGVTFRTMFRKVVTEQYPKEKFPTAPRFHGRHQLNRWPDGLEKCVGCELCAWACPADAIYVEGADNTEDERFSPGERYGRVYQINYLRCILCGLCIEACPTRALTMTNEYELADSTRESLIYEKADLLAPLLPGMEQPPHPMLLGDDEGDYYRGTVRAPQGNPASKQGANGNDRPGGRVMIAFWMLAPVMVAAALGLLFARKAVHCALLLAVVMISLAILYAVQGAPFLFAVQIIVYTGAILMLFLFVLMLVGVDASDSVVETIRGQRLFAIIVGLLFGITLVVGVAQVSVGAIAGLDQANEGGNVPAIAQRPVHQVRLRLRDHLGTADHRGARRDGARPPRAPGPQARAGRHGSPADARLRRARQAPRPAARTGCLRPQQRGRHPGAAPRRHCGPVLDLAGPRRTRHRQGRSGARA